jgi:hypothetical protein
MGVRWIMVEYGYKDIITVQLFLELERLRKETLTSMEKISFILGVSSQAYKNWKNNAAVPNVRLVRKFQIAIDWLEENKEEERRKNAKQRAESRERAKKTRRRNKNKRRRSDSV